MIFAPGDANAIEAVLFGDFCREMSRLHPFCESGCVFDERAHRAFMAALFDALEEIPQVLVGQRGRESSFLNPSLTVS